MPIRYLLHVLPAALLLLVLPCSQSAQTPHKLGTWLDEHGSVPPIPQWFACMRELDDKPYDKKKSQSCLDSILSHPEIEKGKLIFKRHKVEDVLTFRVESPSLSVTDVDFGIAPSDLAKVHDLLAVNGRALHPGGIYEHTGEASSRLVLDMLLRSQGRRAGISSTVRDEYRPAEELFSGILGDRMALI
jgi:hypothetical protein